MLALKQAVPPYLADQNGIEILKEIESFVELSPGEISYTLRDAPSVLQFVDRSNVEFSRYSGLTTLLLKESRLISPSGTFCCQKENARSINSLEGRSLFNRSIRTGES